MATKKITTSLFSFKTFRSPDKIDYNDRKVHFIEHPNFLKSKFYNSSFTNAKENSEKQISVFINSFKPASSYKEIRAINPALYDYSCLLMQQLKNDSTKKLFNAKAPAPLKDDVLLKIWDELFIQTATQKSKTVRQACIQLIIAQHYLQNNKSLELKDISKLVVVIPNSVIEGYKLWRFAKCGGKLLGVHNLGVQEYRRVEQTLCCYVPGEVSHIDNIMAKEYKERSTRNLLRTEYSTEFTSETEIENLNDTTTTERNEISTEVAKELQKDKSFNLSGSVTVSKDSKIFGSITANVSSGYNSNNSSSQSNTEAKKYAKEITERALERVVQKTSEKRTYKMTKEFEENNKHGFDNRAGNEHITGVYRWVDKVYDNEMINYGRRLLFEVSVPSPAKFYKMAMLWQNKKAETQQNSLTPPKTLASFGITNTSIIIKGNEAMIQNAANYYGVAVTWPEIEKIKTFALNYNGLGYNSQTLNTALHTENIQADYECNRVTGRFNVNYKGNRTANGRVVSYFHFGNNSEGAHGYYASGSKDKDREFSFDKAMNPTIVNQLSCYFRYQQVGSLSGSFSLYCKLSASALKAWQEEVYNEMQQSYLKLKEKHDEELKLQQAAQEVEADQKDNKNYSNATMNRLIEERELKRICIEMMSKPYCYDLGKSFYDCKDYKCDTNCETIENKVPEITQNEALEKYAEFIKFFETAFHWEIFSYIFYPYYYNSKCEWSELLQTKNDDPIFEAFLQSGMAKILVPVRPQFAKAVMWYIETGEIYTDENLVPETEDDRYLSLISELENQDEIKVEGTWKTRIPSTLTIIQSDTTYLKGEGLPCCDSESKLFTQKVAFLEGLKSE